MQPAKIENGLSLLIRIIQKVLSGVPDKMLSQQSFYYCLPVFISYQEGEGVRGSIPKTIYYQ